MESQNGLYIHSKPIGYRLNVSDCSTTSYDRDSLSIVLNGIQQLGKIPRGICGANFCHEIRLSDFGVEGGT